jgi:hypothetical protein
LAAADTSGESTGMSPEAEADTEPEVMGSTDATEGDDVIPGDVQLQISGEPVLDFGLEEQPESETDRGQSGDSDGKKLNCRKPIRYLRHMNRMLRDL